MLIGEKGEIECTMYVESEAIWPKTVSKERKERRVVETRQELAKDNGGQGAPS